MSERAGEQRYRRRGPSRRVRRRRTFVAVLAIVLGSVVTFLLVGSDDASTSKPRQSAGGAQSTTTVPARPVLLLTPSGVTVRVVGQSKSGWDVTTPCGRRAVVKSGRALSAIDVMIDPGHGGREVGAVAHGLKESQVNLQVAGELQRALAAKGLNAALTRTGDYRVPIATRAAIIKAAHPKLFVSVHHNGGDAAHHDGPGTEVYYQRRSANSKRLAGLVWEDLHKRIKPFSSHWVGSSDAGAIFRMGSSGNDFYGMLRLTADVPGVLTEAVYLSNASEAALLKRAEFRQAEADGIADAIARFLTSTDRGSGFKTPLVRSFSDPGGGGTANNCVDPKLEAGAVRT